MLLGSLLKLLIENSNQKKDCLSNSKNPACSWILQRKYFALSAVCVIFMFNTLIKLSVNLLSDFFPKKK